MKDDTERYLIEHHMRRNSNAGLTIFKALIGGVFLALHLVSSVAIAASQCQKELPLAQVKGMWPWADEIYETPTEMLRSACPEGIPLVENTVQRSTAPTAADPYPQWTAFCYRPPTDPLPESPICAQPTIGYPGSCNGADGSKVTIVTIRMNAAFCNGKVFGALVCGGGDNYLRCPAETDKNIGSCGDGNPINCTTSNKHQDEIDLSLNSSPLKFVRSYNSITFVGNAHKFSSGLGPHWRHSYSRAVVNASDQDPGMYVVVIRPNGQSFQYVKDSTSGLWETTSDVSHHLLDKFNSMSNFIGYEFHDSGSQEIETYDATGRLVSIQALSGQTVSLTYGTGGLSSATDSSGRSLTFQYTSGLLTQMTDMDGGAYQYQYDSDQNLITVIYPNSTQKNYLYNESSHTNATNLPNALTGITDEAGQRFATFEYDSQGRAISTERAGGTYKYTLSYPYNGAIVTDPLGKVSTRSFTAIQGAIKISSQSESAGSGGPSASRNTSYDDNANITSATDLNGNQTTYSYDLARNLEISRTEAYGTSKARTITTQWHSTYRLPTSISIYSGGSASGTPLRTTSFTYDSAGNQLTKTITDPATTQSRTWTYTYTSYGRVLTADGPRTDVSDVTTYTYNTCSTGYGCGQVATIMDAAGHVTTYNTYNAHGQPLTITDPNGVVTTLTYDARQRLTSRTVGSETTSFEYWPTGLLKKVTLPDSSHLSYTYDAAHRLTQIQDAEGNKVVYTLDAMGNHTAENLYDPSNALARTHSRVYNSLNQLWKDVSAAASSAQTTVFGYDNNGNQTTINAPLTRNSSSQYDALNRLSQVTDANSGLTQYAYDANDNLTAVTDPRSLTTSYSYNGFGDLTTQVSPDTGTTGHTYDSAGNLATRTDARAKTATYSYDALNRVTQIAYSDQTQSFTYDAGTNGLGRLTGASDATHALAWTYDAQGRVTGAGQTLDGLTKGIGYGYTNGLLTQLVTPSGQTLHYAYSHGRITSITVNGNTLLSNVLYDPFGPTRGWTWGNSTLSNRTYDQDGNISQIDSGEFYSYSLDDAFRITGITHGSNSALSWSYGYDALDRLNSAAKTSATFGWTYDANGNRLSQTSTNASTFTIASTSNKLSATSGTLSRTYTYDNAGNATSDGTNTFTYSDAGRMISANNGSITTTYTYNALGQRVKKSNATGTTYFVYDQAGHLIGEYDGSGNLIQETIWLNDIPVATLIPNGTGGVYTYYVHTDHLNTPRKISRPSDDVIVWRWDSDAFGNGAPDQDPDGNSVQMTYNQRLPGQYYDAETGLNYNAHRDYDPMKGGYIQSDPIGLAGGQFSTYAYAHGNPIMNVDPSGLGAAGNPHPVPTHVEYGVGGCIGTACVDSKIGDTAPDVSVPFLPEIGGAFHFCIVPDKPTDDCAKPKPTKKKESDFTINFGLGDYLGITFGTDGSACLNIGFGGGSPINAYTNMGPLW